MSPESRMRYNKTITELDLFLTGHSRRLVDLSEQMMADWAVELLNKGLAKTTVSRHLNCLNGMLKAAAEQGMIAHSDIPRTLSKSLSENKEPLPPLMCGPTFDGCLSILRKALSDDEGGRRDVCIDMILFSMLGGALPLERVSAIRKDEVPGYDGVCHSILIRNIAPRRDYVFNLRQSMRTRRQLESAIASGLQAVFGKHFGPDGRFAPDEFVRSMWVACAMKSGLTASEALSHVGGTAAYALPRFCTPSTVIADGKQAWVTAVSSMLLSEMPRWYAMHIRKGVSYDELRREICEKVRPCPELYYPCETITRQHRGVKIVKEQPYIDRTAFFRSRPEDIHPMFGIIGAKAWCYRVSGMSDSPYAVIPRRDMERFQRAIGVFTPDMEILPLGGLTPRPGESVIVVMAGFGNRTGKVEEIINKDCGSVIFRVKLDTDSGYEFRVDVDGRQIERIIG